MRNEGTQIAMTSRKPRNVVSGTKRAPPRAGRSQQDGPVREWKARFIDAMTRSLSIRAACEVAGVSRRTYNETRAKDPDFAEAVDEARLSVLDDVEAALVAKAKEGEYRHAIAVLERYDPAWRKRRDPRQAEPPLVFKLQLGNRTLPPEDDGVDDRGVDDSLDDNDDGLPRR
ncbi:MAG: hypothetical protein DK306_001705 [Chloroflexi bacterium]|nr:MAG: hypothetical protein DK306_001705 [Chloroflexota bacterium]